MRPARRLGAYVAASLRSFSVEAVTVKRWQLVAIFLLIAASSTVGLHQLKEESAQTQRLAAKANTLAVLLKHQAAVGRTLRNEQLALGHRLDERSCASRHEIVVAERGFLNRGIKDWETAALSPGLTAEQQAYVRARRAEHIVSYRKSLRELRRADCLSIPDLPRAPKKPAKASPANPSP